MNLHYSDLKNHKHRAGADTSKFKFKRTSSSKLISFYWNVRFRNASSFITYESIFLW